LNPEEIAKKGDPKKRAEVQERKGGRGIKPKGGIEDSSREEKEGHMRKRVLEGVTRGGES